MAQMGDKQVSRKRARPRLEKIAAKARGNSQPKGGPPKNKKLVSQVKGRLPNSGRQ